MPPLAPASSLPPPPPPLHLPLLTEVIHGVLGGLARGHADEDALAHVIDGAEERLVFDVEPRQDARPPRVGEEDGSVSAVCAGRGRERGQRAGRGGRGGGDG